MKKCLITLLIICGLSGLKASSWQSSDEPNIIVVVLDGIRWQDVFSHPKQSTRLPKLFKRYGKRAVTKGNLFKKQPFETAAVPKSLPVYQTLFSGKIPYCWHNYCGRIKKPTFAQRLLRDPKFKRKDVAIIASWDHLRYAAQNEAGSLLVNAGLSTFRLPDRTNPGWLKALNRMQRQYRPGWRSARYDAYSIKFSLRYIERYRPRFMFVALNDADEWAHDNSYWGYYHSLKLYDQYLQSLFEKLDDMGRYGRRTNVIITSDHGRGKGKRWTSHGRHVPSSKYTWFVAVGPDIERNRKAIYKNMNSMVDMQTLIESIFYSVEESKWAAR